MARRPLEGQQTHIAGTDTHVNIHTLLEICKEIYYMILRKQKVETRLGLGSVDLLIPVAMPSSGLLIYRPRLAS